MAATAAMLFEERPAKGGGKIGVATLNSPATLNALSLEMAQSLDGQLARWATQAEILAVVLRGAGERAFCAGGDIQDLYRAMARNHVPAHGWTPGRIASSPPSIGWTTGCIASPSPSSPSGRAS